MLLFSSRWLLPVAFSLSGLALVASCSGDEQASSSSSSSTGASSSSSSSGESSTSGSGGAGGAACAPEICDGIDNDCDGAADNGASCAVPGERCAGGKCTPDCASPGATPCDAGKVCNVGGVNPGACVDAGSKCLVANSIAPCGAFQCGPGTRCDSATMQCASALPCKQIVCEGGVCHGAACLCDRPPPSCAAATLDQLNDNAFTFGLVDMDFDLKCNAWGVTVISGPDYLRKVDPATGQVSSVQGVSNIDMGEVAALQGVNGTFGGAKTEVALTYNCCAGCGCDGIPQGLAYFDQPNNALPIVIPSGTLTAGAGPFKNKYLDNGPAGLTFGLSLASYVGNVDADGDFHSIDLKTQTKALVAQLPARVYAATPFEGTRVAVALATKEILLLDVQTGMTTPFAVAPDDVTGLARDPFTGHMYISLYGGEIRELSVDGADLGHFAKGQTSGRISLAGDNYLYQLNVAPVAKASIERFPLPATY